MGLKYKCLVFDHDDTVVNSTATIHYPCFVEYLNKRGQYDGITLDQYFIKNFEPGFLEMLRQDYRMDDDDITDETKYWIEYVKEHIPDVYPGIKEIMERQRSEGGLICVASHSMKENILRDYRYNGLPEPDMIFGWDLPRDLVKPAPYSLNEIMRVFDLEPSDILMIDDLKPGYDMAKSCGVDFAGVGWSYDVPYIESFMRENCGMYFKEVSDLAEYLEG